MRVGVSGARMAAVREQRCRNINAHGCSLVENIPDAAVRGVFSGGEHPRCLCEGPHPTSLRRHAGGCHRGLHGSVGAYLQKRMCSPVPPGHPPPRPTCRLHRHRIGDHFVHVPQARLYVVSATGDHNLPHPAPPVPDTHVSGDEVETILPNGSLTHMSARMSPCVHGRCLTSSWQDTPQGNGGTGGGLS